MTWLLLIYSVPAQPSRKRAFVWREVKRVGAIYLRDGVCVLPDTPALRAAFHAIAEKVEEFGGQATLVEGAQLPQGRVDTVIAESQAARAAEYQEIASDAEGFLEHVRRETDHREFTFTEVEELEEDLAKLQRWAHQVKGRDYFPAREARGAMESALARGEEALAAFLETAYLAQETTS